MPSATDWAAQNSQFCADLRQLCHASIAAHNGGSARGYLGVGGYLSSPGMAYWVDVCPVYLYIAILRANVRICRDLCVDGFASSFLIDATRSVQPAWVGRHR